MLLELTSIKGFIKLYIKSDSLFLKISVALYRVIHDLWTLLQEVISYVFVIKKVHINMCPILGGYGVMTA